MLRSCAPLLLALCAIGFQSGQAQVISDSEAIARLKANRSLYSRWDIQPSLPELVRTQQKDISRVPSFFHTPAIDPSHPPQQFDANDHPRLKEATTHSELIVIGAITRNISALTEKAGFIFTDSQMTVEKVLGQSPMNREVNPVAAGSEITVTAIGGSLAVERYHVSAYLPNETPLKKGGKYLLFLRYVPESKSYRLVDLEGFDLNSETPQILRRDIPNPFAKTSTADFAANAAESVSKIALDSTETR